MTVTLKQVEAFVRVADLGSFRRAADQLNTTQPNISARIAALESALGAVLMTRDAGSVRLTAKGRALLGPARHVLRGVEDMVGALGDTALVQGVLRLGVTEMIVHTWLGDFLKALKRRYPQVLVELTVDLSANLSTALFDRHLDLAFQSGPFSRAIGGMVDLGAYPMVWVAGVQIPLTPGVPLSMSELLAHPILTHARGTLPYDQLATHVAAARHPGARLVPSSNLAACLQMVQDGFGVACLPRAMVADAVSAGRLVPLSYGWSPAPLRFAARYDAERAAAFVAEAATVAAQSAGRYGTSQDKKS